MAQTYHIRSKRGLKADLPASGRLGEIFYCTDTEEAFVGHGDGLPLTPLSAPTQTGDVDATQIQGVDVLDQVPEDGQVLIFDFAADKWIPGDPIVSGPDAVGADATRNPVQIGGIDGAGKVRQLFIGADGRITVSVVAMPLADNAATAGNQVVEIAGLSLINSKLAAPLPLPTGAATEATLADIKSGTDNLDVALSSLTTPSDTQPISAAALPLPTGAATEATIAAVNAKLGAALPLATGAATEATLAGVNSKLGAALPLPTGAATESGLGTDGATPPAIAGTGARGWLRAIYEKLLAGLAVTGTFWQATQPVSLATQPLPTGASTETTLAAVNSKLGAALPLPTGAATETTLASVNTKLAAALPLPTGAATEVTLATVSTRVLALSKPTDVQVSSASGETGTIYNGQTALTPKFIKIVVSTIGASSVVPLVAGKKIRVLKWDLVASAAVNVKWQSHTTPTDLTGLYYCGANGGLAPGFCPVGHFETVAGEALDLNLSAAVPVGGSLTYVEV